MEQEAAEIEEALHALLIESDLLAFENMIVFDMQLTQLEHFRHVSDEELMLNGLSLPAIRRLRCAIEKHQKLIKKGKVSKEEQSRRLKVFKKRPQNSKDSNNPSPCLIQKDEVKIIESLGEGTFAVVKRAVWTHPDGNKSECAVKILRNMAEEVRADIISEISSMQRLRHQNLVQLYGVIFDTKTLMVMEFCDGGSLLNRLRDRSKEKLLVTTLLKYSQQIASGMAYLESRRFVHRDLAARNILLAKNDEIVKICDFGLTRSLGENERLYVMSAQKKVPFAWCPPESLRFRQFSHKSDMWSFGVTLWELFTYGEDPWIGLGAADVLRVTESGERLRQPTYCSGEIYDIMKMCWNLLPEERPKFSHLRKILLDVKFMTVVCRHERTVNNPTAELEFSISDKIILINERNGTEWYGQNIRTRNFGTFPRSGIAVETPEPIKQQSSPYKKLDNQEAQFLHRREISCPITGSFIHTGHGDINEDHCWGYIEKIDDIYLKNPILTAGKAASLPQKVAIVPSLHSLTNLNTESNDFKESLGVGEEICGFTRSPESQASTSWSSSIIPQTSGGSLLENRGRKSFNNSLNAFDEWLLTTSSNSSPSNNKVSSVRGETSSSSQELMNLSGKQYSSTVSIPPPPPITANNNLSRKGSSASTTSKYDSFISIPRPNRFSPTTVAKSITPPPLTTTAMYAQTTSRGTFIDFRHNPQQQANYSMTTKSAVVSPSSSHNNNSEFPNSLLSSSSNSVQPSPSAALPLPTLNSSYTHKHSSSDTTFRTPECIGIDPFEINENVKTFTKKLRYNEVHQQLTNDTHTKAEQEITKDIPKSEFGAIPESTNGFFSSLLTRQLSPQESSQSAIISSQQQTTSQTASARSEESAAAGLRNPPDKSKYSSLLPPPSELLLNGLATTNGLPYAKPNNNQSSSNTTSRPIAPRDKLLFDLATQSNGLEENKYDSFKIPKLRYGSNGIPILEPIPFNYDALPKMTKKQNLDGNPSRAPLIDLKELDRDVLTNKVHRGANFANVNECWHSLKLNDFDPEKAIRRLKIERLIEIGVATDKDLAESALDSCQWDISAAVDRLIS